MMNQTEERDDADDSEKTMLMDHIEERDDDDGSN